MGMFVLALIYNVVHAAALFYQVITLNVAVNSYSNALLTLLLSNQFVEIKSTVFKKIEKDNLFQLTCADIVERFQLWLMLMIIALRNIVEVGGFNILGAATGSDLMKDTPRSNSILPNSFTILPNWTGEVLSPSDADFIGVGLYQPLRCPNLLIGQAIIVRQRSRGLKPEFRLAVGTVYMDVHTRFLAREKVNRKLPSRNTVGLTRHQPLEKGQSSYQLERKASLIHTMR